MGGISPKERCLIMRFVSDKQKVLTFMESHRKITQKDANRLYVSNLSVVICELERDGIYIARNVVTNMWGGRTIEYSLIS